MVGRQETVVQKHRIIIIIIIIIIISIRTKSTNTEKQ